MKTRAIPLLLSTGICFTGAVNAKETATEAATVTVFAAASLTNALNDIDAEFEKTVGDKVVPAFASSSALAKQIENGAPADVFISADEKWMDYLAGKSKIDNATRHDLLGNTLVLVAPKGSNAKVTMDKKFKFDGAFSGKLCTGDPEKVPVGIYAKQSLQHLAWWDGITSRIVPAEDVRAALMFVERKECDFGIVYGTDAKVSDKVETVATFPEESHEPIRYPVAVISGEQKQGAAFVKYLSSKAAKEVFKKYGFTVLDSTKPR